MKHTVFESLLQPFLAGAPTNTQFFTKEGLLRATGITPRQLRYYTEMGAVSPAIGHTRAARYTIKHLHQVERVVSLLRSYSTSVREIAEAYAESIPGVKPAKQRYLANSAQVDKLIVHRVTEGIRIVVNENLSPTEMRLLQELLKTSKLSAAKRVALAREAITPDTRLLNELEQSRRRRASKRRD